MVECGTCKYDPSHATQAMKDLVYTRVGHPSCYHPDAYKNGSQSHEFWDKSIEECYVSAEGV